MNFKISRLHSLLTVTFILQIRCLELHLTKKIMKIKEIFPLLIVGKKKVVMKFVSIYFLADFTISGASNCAWVNFFLITTITSAKVKRKISPRIFFFVIMGNQQAAVQRERNKSGSQDLIPGSPIRGESSLLRSLETVQNRQHLFFAI